jgi:putative phosphoribosyl transferase
MVCMAKEAHMISASEVAPQFPVEVADGPVTLEGYLGIPDISPGIVVFAHGSGSGRNSPRNQAVAAELRRAGLGTLLIDLLTAEEEREDRHTGHLRFDIDLLAVRLAGATEWLAHNPDTSKLTVGYFGASTGAAAALVAAARWSDRISGVVSRGGRPDLAGAALTRVYAPTLLIVGGDDEQVLELNSQALARLAAPEKRMEVIPGAGHLFEEPGKLEQVAHLAADWFGRHLRRASPVGSR